MRIVDTDIWTVVVPVRPGRVNSPEFGMASWPKMPKQILRLRTDAGVVGLGETSRGCPREAVEAGAQALVGRDPLGLPLQDLPLVGDEEKRHGPRSGYEGLCGPSRSSPAYDAFEMAIFDLCGRALGVPAHWRVSSLPISVEPVNDSLRTVGLAVISPPIARVSFPVITFRTPAGTPARPATSQQVVAVPPLATTRGGFPVGAHASADSTAGSIKARAAARAA